MTSRCARCGRFKKPDGILLCPRCGPPGDLRQDAWVTPQTIAVGVATGGDPPARPPQPPATSKMKATVKRGNRRGRLTAKLERGVWSHDRQAFETREMVVDRDGNKHYRQEWTNPDTGETTFRKTGRLDDPTMHGRASHEPPADD